MSINPTAKTTNNKWLDAAQFFDHDDRWLRRSLRWLPDDQERLARRSQCRERISEFNAYIRIGTDNHITILFGGCELGRAA